jgi:hypothetical protein
MERAAGTRRGLLRGGEDGEGSSSNRTGISRGGLGNYLGNVKGEGSSGTFSPASFGAQKSAAGTPPNGSAAKGTNQEANRSDEGNLGEESEPNRPRKRIDMPGHELTLALYYYYY